MDRLKEGQTDRWKIMLLLLTLNMRVSHVASLVLFVSLC